MNPADVPDDYCGGFEGADGLNGAGDDGAAGADGATLPPADPPDGADCDPGVSILTSAR